MIDCAVVNCGTALINQTSWTHILLTIVIGAVMVLWVMRDEVET